MTVPVLAGASGAGPQESGRASTPFRFLDFFTEVDRERFQGREQETQTVAAQLLRGRTFVLYGASGTGKTSLILAGLFPELVERGYVPLYVRTLEDPESDLTNAVRAGLRRAEEPFDGEIEDALELLRSVSRRRPVVLALDQFEEFFINLRGRAEERARFARLIACLLEDQEIDVRILFSLRQDYLAELDDLRAFLPNLFQNEYRLRPLTAFGARQAISSALSEAGVGYERRFLTDVVELLEGTRFDPTILQLVCSEIFRRACERQGAGAGAVRLGTADLEGIGSVEELFRGYVESMVADLEPEARLTAFCVLDALVSKERTKRALTMQDLLTAGFVARAEEVEEVLELLERHRLVRAEPRGERIWYELIHDRLVPIVIETLDSEETFFRFRGARQLVGDGAAERWDADPELLLREGQLKTLVAPHAPQLRLDERQLEFLFRSAVYRESDEQVELWGRRLDERRRVEVLRELIDDATKRCQRQAARAAAVLGERRVADGCAELALEGADEETREAAARALGDIGTTAQIEYLREALGRDPRGRRARDAFVSLRLAGDRVEALPPWWRLIVWRRARSELLNRHHQRLRAERRAGVGRSLRIALWWTLTALPLGSSMIVWTEGQQWTGLAGIGVIALATTVGLTLPVVLLVAWILGGFLTLRRERDRLFRRKRSLFRQVFGSKTLGLLVGLPALLLGVAATEESLFALPLGLLLAVGAIAVVALSAQLSARAVLDCREARIGERWALVGAVGVPVLVPFLVSLVVHDLPDWTRSLSYAALVLSALSAIASSALVGDLTEPESSPWPRPQTYGRHLVLAFALLASNLWLFVLGVDTLPFRVLATEVALGDGSGAMVEGSLGPLIPDADYVSVVAGEPRVLRISGEHPPRMRLDRISLGRSRLLFLSSPWSSRGADVTDVMIPAGRHWLALGSDSETGEYGLSLEDLAIESIDEGTTLGPEWSYHLVTGDVVEKGSIGAISGRADSDPEGRRQVVELLVFRTTVATELAGREGSVRVTPLADDVRPVSSETVHLAFTDRVSILEFPADESDAVGPTVGGTPRTVFEIPVDPEKGRWGASVQLTLDAEYFLPEDAQEVSFPVALRIRPLEAVSAATLPEEVSIEELLGEAEAYAKVELMNQAHLAFEQAAERAVGGERPLLNHTICLKGCAAGLPHAVISACDRAIELEPTQGEFRDTRGRCRVQLGDFMGAIDDFHAFLGSDRAAKLPAESSQREQWIEELNEGVEPRVWGATVPRSLGAALERRE